MEPDLPEIDEAGLRRIAQIERALRKLDPDDIGAFISITNALEYHLERSPPHAETVQLLAQALDRYVASRGIEPRAAGFAQPLAALLHYAR
jgi:hypothetical protein